jgi:hypothetical protein
MGYYILSQAKKELHYFNTIPPTVYLGVKNDLYILKTLKAIQSF